jgi:hypothetical protein
MARSMTLQVASTSIPEMHSQHSPIRLFAFSPFALSSPTLLFAFFGLFRPQHFASHFAIWKWRNVTKLLKAGMLISFLSLSRQVSSYYADKLSFSLKAGKSVEDGMHFALIALIAFALTP